MTVFIIIWVKLVAVGAVTVLAVGHLAVLESFTLLTERIERSQVQIQEIYR